MRIILVTTKQGKNFKKVMTGLDWMDDDKWYDWEYNCSLLEIIKMEWWLHFPPKVPQYDGSNVRKGTA